MDVSIFAKWSPSCRRQNRNESKRTCAAFTFVDLCIVVALLIILVAFLAPAMRRAKFVSRPFSCANNLKQVGISFVTWSIDNSNRFPMQVPVSEGGTMGLASGRNPFVNFVVMSNELSTPKVLICPQDKKRTYATNFFSDFNNGKLSYFVELDALATNASLILCGDRNITNGLPLRNGLLELPSNRPTGWTYELHEGEGNILLADGSVQHVTTSYLRELIKVSGFATNRLAIP